MNIGVCAPGTDGFNFFTRKLNNGRFEIILDCLSGRLGLPALERTAVVLEFLNFNVSK